MADKKSKNWKKIWWTVVFVVLNIAVIVITAVNEFGNSENAAELVDVEINGWWLVPAAACFVVMLELEFLKYVVMLRKAPKEDRFGYKEARKVARRTVILGRYYDRITPASVGGQPFQIYNIHKTGKVSNGLAAAIPIFSMIAGQVAFLAFAIPCFLFGGLAETRPTLLGIAWIGLLFYAFWPVLVAGGIFWPKQTAKIINFFVKILAKLRIVKNREEALARVEKEIYGYTDSVKTILKNPKVFWGVLAMSLVSNLLVVFIPYFVLTAFGGNVGFIECFALTTAVSSAIYFVPTPGNSGAAEGTFYMVFSSLSTGYVFWAMLVWRLFSYYIYILMGPLTYLGIRLERKRERLTAREK